MHGIVRLFVSAACVLSIANWNASPTLAQETRAISSIEVWPKAVELADNFAQTQFVVRDASDGTVNDRSADLTASAKFESADSKIVRVLDRGRIVAVGNGETELIVSVEGHKQVVPVKVTGFEQSPIVDYNRYIQPTISKLGCNMGACHASQYGKGGFKLSVFSASPKNDWQAITRDRVGRRINRVTPKESLFLRKPTMDVPHGGSLRLTTRSTDYAILAAWIRSGAAGPVSSKVKIERIEVTPKRRIFTVKSQQQLRVDAIYSDGSTRDITPWAKFDSVDDAMLGVSTSGMVTALDHGQAPIMIRYEGQAEISMFVVPYDREAKLAGWKNNNVVDELASAKFRELGIEPSGLCDDATFIRRVYLDAIGTLPEPEVVREFLASKAADKRDKIVDRLLGLTGDSKLDTYNDQYAAYWTLKWSDLIQNTSNKVGDQGMWALHNWIKESFRVNKPFDQFVTELVTAKGSIYRNGPANYFRIHSNASLLTEATAQLFLGIRLECAKCHHHPFEKYSQADYQDFSKFFSQVATKNSQEFGLFGRESIIMVRPNPATRATPLGGESTSHDLDIRIPMAEWLTSSDNHFFARSVVNRYVSYLLGRGLVEPVDDMRETNPPTNVALMEALAKQLIDSKFDLKQLMRAILTSRLYQLDSRPTDANKSDRKFYAYFKAKRLQAEPLLDAIDTVTGVKTKFENLPLGTRAIELPDAEYPNYFLTTFAKPRRASVCECERMPDENLAQALHTLNGDILATKIADKTGRVAKLLESKQPLDASVSGIFLATLSRQPSQAELDACKQMRAQAPSEKEFLEDLMWALINSKHFLYVR